MTASGSAVGTTFAYTECQPTRTGGIVMTRIKHFAITVLASLVLNAAVVLVLHQAITYA